MEIGFIGAGKVDTSLGNYFTKKDLSVSGYYSKSRSSSERSAELTGAELFEDLDSLLQSSGVVFITTGDDAIPEVVKLEGGVDVADKVRAIVKAQIPVMGHIGLTPQSVNVFGGFKVQGKDQAQAMAVIEDAVALEKAGVFAIVLEGIPEKLARLITEKVSIPTIGIGAGRYCDGQVLVIHDLLGMYSGQSPKFSKGYAALNETIKTAIENYVSEVKELKFPEEKHTFTIDDEIIAELSK